MDVAGGHILGIPHFETPCVRPEDVLAHCVKLRIPPNYTPDARPEDVLAHLVKMGSPPNY